MDQCCATRLPATQLLKSNTIALDTHFVFPATWLKQSVLAIRNVMSCHSMLKQIFLWCLEQFMKLSMNTFINHKYVSQRSQDHPHFPERYQALLLFRFCDYCLISKALTYLHDSKTIIPVM